MAESKPYMLKIRDDMSPGGTMYRSSYRNYMGVYERLESWLQRAYYCILASSSTRTCMYMYMYMIKGA